MQLSASTAKSTFFITAFVLLGLSVLLYRQISTLVDSQKQLSQTTLLKMKLEQLQSVLLSTETAQRGFLLSKDSAFLTPYQGAHEKVKTILSYIKLLTNSSAFDRNGINSFETLVELRFGTFQHLIQHFDNPKLSAANKKSQLLRSKNLMDSIRLHAENISAVADNVLKQETAENEKYNFLTPFYAVLLMALATGILIFSYEKNLQQLKRTRQLFLRLKNMHNKLKHRNYQLELYNRELNSFANIASHDLKEPARKILTFASILEDSTDTEFSAEDADRLKTIKKAAERMHSLSDDLSHYCHSTMTGKKFTEVNLNEVVGEAVQRLRDQVEERDAKIYYRCLPSVRGIPFQLQQLFENLISNSLQYARPSFTPKIIIDATIVSQKKVVHRFYKTSKQYLQIKLKDNGSGFDQAYSEKIFGLFQRLQTRHAGTGIGLTICKRIVDNHDGYITANSEVNRGTTFEIYLPA